MDTVQDRISKLAIHAGNKSMKGLAQLLGQNPQVLYDIRSGKTKEISARLANKIFLAFPDISETWLFTGEGEMLRSSVYKKESAPEVFPSADALKLYLEMMETIRIQAETIKKLTEGDESQKRAII